MAQDLASAITERLGVVVLARWQAGAVGQGLADGGRTGGTLPIELPAGQVGDPVLLEIDAVTRQYPEPIATDPLRQPYRIGPQDVGELVDQGIAEVEPRPGGEGLRQLGQQGVLQQRGMLGEPGSLPAAVRLSIRHLEGRQPAAAQLLRGHVLAAPEHMVQGAGVIAEVADKLAWLTRMVESGEKVGEAGFILWRQPRGPGMRSLPLPGLARDMIGQTPLLMLPIIKPHHLSGLLFHLRLQHYNYAIHPEHGLEGISTRAHIPACAWRLRCEERSVGKEARLSGENQTSGRHKALPRGDRDDPSCFILPARFAELKRFLA
ncbi:hypothetical protein D3C79_582990 [compost metagenome]